MAGASVLLDNISRTGGRKQWGGHLLMTDKGIYFNAPSELTKKNREDIFVPWYNIGKPSFKTLWLENVGKILKLQVVILRATEEESIDEFIERGKKFVDLINQFRIPAREKKALELYNFLKENKRCKREDYMKNHGEITKSFFKIVKKNLNKGNQPTTNLE